MFFQERTHEPQNLLRDREVERAIDIAEHGGRRQRPRERRRPVDSARRARRVRIVRVPMAVPYGLGMLNQALARLPGFTPMLTPGKVREFYHSDWVCDPGPIMARTSWQPTVSLRDGFAATIAWYRQQGWL